MRMDAGFVTKQEIVRDVKAINKCINVLESLGEEGMFTRIEYFYSYGEDVKKGIKDLENIKEMLCMTYEIRYKEKL